MERRLQVKSQAQLERERPRDSPEIALRRRRRAWEMVAVGGWQHLTVFVKDSAACPLMTPTSGMLLGTRSHWS